MNQWWAHPEPYAIAGAMIAMLLVAGWMLVSNHRTVKRRAKSAKLYEDREKLATKTYDEFAEEYRKVRAKLSGKYHEIEVVEILQDISDYSAGRDHLDQRITNDVALAILEQISAAKDKELAVVLHTLGGYAFPSEMIADAIRSHPKRTRVYIPYVAMSGGTIIALAADEIYMSKSASLGPIDAQFGAFPADAYIRLVQDKPPQFIHDATLLTSYVAEKYESGARERAADLLNRKYGFDPKKKPRPKRKGWFSKPTMPKPDREKMLKVVDHFLSKELYHGAKISAEKAKGFGVTISGDCSKDVYALVNARLRMLWKSDPPKEATILLAPVVQMGQTNATALPVVMHEAPGARSTIKTPSAVVPQNEIPPQPEAPKS